MSDPSDGASGKPRMGGIDDSPASAAAAGWLARRIDGVPPEFLPWLREHGAVPGSEGSRKREDAGDDPPREVEGGGDDVGDVSRALEARGLDALLRALEAPGRVRESAFRLLAADAYLTWASEALLDLDDPEAALEDLVRRVARADR